MKSFNLPENPALVIASDVHIRTPHDDRYTMLCELVEHAARVGAKSFVLNGDIFDFFFGWSSYFRTRYGRLLSGLDQLAGRGATVWFVEGNHEFGLTALSRHYRFDVVPSEGRVMLLPKSQRLLIAHGDLLSDDFWYKLFRTLMRSPMVNLLAAAFPQALLDRLTLWLASTSRKKDKYRELNHRKIIAGATQKLKAANADVIVFGHFHHPYDEKLEGQGRLLSVTSWDEPSCLVVTHDGEILRIKPN